MAKEKERATARILYVNQMKSAKEIAGLLNVSEQTIANWVKKYAWKEARTAKLTNEQMKIENIKEIIASLAKNRLNKQRELDTCKDEDRANDLRKEITVIDNSVAYWNKALAQADKESQISLRVYLHVMDEIFNDMQANYPDLYIKTLDFQETHINKKSIELG